MYLLVWGECPGGLPFTSLNAASECAMRLMARWQYIRIDKATGTRWSALEIIPPKHYAEVSWMPVFEWRKREDLGDASPSAASVFNKAMEE